MKKRNYASVIVHKIIILLLIFMSSPTMGYGALNKSQKKEKLLSLSQRTIKEVLDYIEKNSDYIFLHGEGLDLSKSTSISVQKQNVDEILNDLLSEAGMKYVKEGRQISIYNDLKTVPSKLDTPNEKQEKIHKIQGVILEEKTNEPIIGAVVSVPGNALATAITDVNGNYQLDVPDGTLKISVSYMGFETLEIPFHINNLNVFRVILMKESSTSLDEVTVVAFAKQKKESVIGSITTVKPSDLKVPSSNLTTALAGRMAGMIAYQRSGEPGKDNADFFIRGVTTFGYKADPLILIDGVELTSQDLSRLQPDDIESFSIMKDATSSALYGARGANGVILVTTKEGVEGKLKVSARFETTFSEATRKLKIADPITYMRKFNESVTTRNPLAAQPYSAEKIDNTIAGTNPYVYPAVDWYKMLFDDVAINHRLNMSLSGGGKIARYYVALTYNKDNGVLKVDKRNNFNSNISLNKIGVRTNVNLSLTKSTEMIIRVNANFDDYKGPTSGGTDMFNKVMRSNPVLFPPYYAPDVNNQYTNHILFGNATTANYINPYAEMVRGFKEYSETKVFAQAELKQDFDFITKGLNARIMANTTRQSYFDLVRSYSPHYYMIDQYDKLNQTYTLKNTNETSATEWLDYKPGTKTITSTFYLEGALQYNRRFAEKHDVGALMVYTMKSSLVGSAENLAKSLAYRNLGFAGRLTYGYDDRYFVEGNFGYNGSERFAKNNRFGFFPSAGLGWVVSNESFFTPLEKVITKLKLKGTYGLVGNDAIGSSDDRFFYLSQVNQNAGTAPGFGLNFDSPSHRPMTSIERYANSDITWEKASKLNVGLESTLFKDLEFQIEYFKENRSKILMERSSITPEMGLEASVKANLGKATAHGIDMSLDYNKYFENGMWLTGRLNFTYSKSKFKFFEEPDYPDAPWRSHKNQPLTGTWGYIAERLFIDQADVDNSPKQFGEYMAGDIKYRDVNKDGIINENDMVPLGHPKTPEIVYGFGLSAGYKGVDVSFFFQGLAKESFWIDQNATAPFVDTDGDGNVISNNALLNVYANNHWSETNQNPYALWPRLSNTIVDNNNKPSTWFMRSGDFLRLKQVDVGYSLPERFTHKFRLSNIRVYLSGVNLLTFSKFKLWDPEMAGNGLGYPIQKSYNIGLQISL